MTSLELCLDEEQLLRAADSVSDTSVLREHTVVLVCATMRGMRRMLSLCTTMAMECQSTLSWYGSHLLCAHGETAEFYFTIKDIQCRRIVAAASHKVTQATVPTDNHVGSYSQACCVMKVHDVSEVLSNCSVESKQGRERGLTLHQM